MRVMSIEAGHQYRLVRPFEVRDEETGTIKEFLLKDRVLRVKRVAPAEDHIWVEGLDWPLPYFALRHHVEQA